MNAVDIIEKKRDGHELSRAEIRFFLQGFTDGDIPDYQAAAWAMAVFFQGMTARETVDLTIAMVESGETLDMSRIGAPVVDKHSTGGVGDKTSLIVAPLVASTGLPVAKMSGRGLGFSGGTLDKLESIPGFDTSLSSEDFFHIVREQGLAIIGQTADLVPADGKLYALRDVTGTVPSLPLIASSIMSKKIAGGANAIVLDVKVGRGAFMETLTEARELALRMIAIGESVGRRVTAVLADMSQPLGHAIGNSLEVIEAIEMLKGRGPDDLRQHCLTIGGEMLLLAGRAASAETAQAELAQAIETGQGLQTFRRWIAAQGGDERVVDDYSLLPQAPVQREILSPQSGYFERIDPRECGLTAVALGAGREVKGAAIDPAVGIVLHAHVGDALEQGDPLLTIYARNEEQADAAAQRLLSACTWSETEIAARPVIHDILRSDSQSL